MLDTLLNRSGTASAAWLDALARRLHGRGVTPNGLTWSALALGIVAALLFYSNHGWLAFAGVLLSGLLDAVDGRVARLGPGPTLWGGVLDLTCDRIVEASILLGIALPHPEWHVPALALFAAWYVNLCIFLAVGAASEKGSEKIINYPPGLLERTEALVFAFIVVVLPGITAAVGYVYAALSVITGIQRLRYGRRNLRAE